MASLPISTTPTPIPKRPKRNQARGPALPASKYSSTLSGSASNITDQELLAFYELNTLNPLVWSEHDPTTTTQNDPTFLSGVSAFGSSSQLSSSSSSSSTHSSTQSLSSSSSSSLLTNSKPTFVPKEGLDPLGLKSNIFKDLPPTTTTTTTSSTSSTSSSSSSSSSALIMKHRAQLSIFSKEFQPNLFLSLIHPQLSFSQFQEGLKKLGSQGEHQSEVMRTLVRDNFHAHIIAKATVDHVFHTMQKKELTLDFDVPFTETLDIGFTTAHQVFGPMLQKRTQMEHIKSTLLLLDRFKFFFHLPSSLNVQVQQGHLEIAVREYKKGKALIQSMYPSLVGPTNNTHPMNATGSSSNQDSSFSTTTTTVTTTTTSNNVASPLGTGSVVGSQDPDDLHAGGPPQQKKWFEKIWSQVCHIMQYVKEQLFKQLQEHDHVTVEHQEQAIQLILEMDPLSDPMGVYLESRGKWILAQLKEKYTLHYRSFQFPSTSSITTTTSINPTITPNDTHDASSSISTTTHKFTANQFKKALFLRNKKEFETVFAKDPEVIAWHSITQLVRVLSDGFISLFPDFYKMLQTYMDTSLPKHSKLSSSSSSSTTATTPAPSVVPAMSFSKKHAMDAKRLESCQRMSYEITVYWTDLLRHAFRFSTKELYLPLFPKLTNVNAFTVAHFAPKFIHTLRSCLDQLQNLHLPTEAMKVVIGFYQQVHETLLEMFIKSWKEDAGLLPLLEDLHSPMESHGPLSSSPTTSYFPTTMTMTHSNITSAPFPTHPSSSSSIAIFSTYTKYMIQCAFKLISSTLSSSSFSVSSRSDTTSSNTIPTTLSFTPTLSVNETLFPIFFSSVQLFLQSLVSLPHSEDRSLLILISQLDIGTHLVSSWLTYLSNLSGPISSSQTSSLVSYVQSVMQDQMKAFVRKQVELVDPILNSGFKQPFVGSSYQEYYDGKNGVKLDLRSWVYQLMTHLNGLHVLLSTLLPNLQSVVLGQVILALTQSMLALIRDLEQLPAQVCAQLIFEITFLQHILQQDLTSSIQGLFTNMLSILNALAPNPNTSSSSSSSIFDHLDSHLDLAIQEVLKATHMQFYCFASKKKGDANM